MKVFDSLEKILPETSALDWDSAVFADMAAWASHPLSTPLTVLEGDDELEDLASVEDHLPRIAAEKGLRQLLDMQTFQDVIDFESKRNKDATPKDFVHALNYYREMDDFFDPGRKVRA